MQYPLELSCVAPVAVAVAVPRMMRRCTESACESEDLLYAINDVTNVLEKLHLLEAGGPAVLSQAEEGSRRGQ